MVGDLAALTLIVIYNMSLIHAVVSSMQRQKRSHDNRLLEVYNLLAGVVHAAYLDLRPLPWTVAEENSPAKETLKISFRVV